MSQWGTTSLRPPKTAGAETTFSSRGNRWTWRAAWAHRSPTTLTIAAVAIVAAAATALHSDVPVAAPIGIAATTPAVLVDVVERRLPNRMLVLAAALMSIATAATATFGVSTSWTNALIGAALMAAPLTIVHVIAPHAMGFGDVKLALVLGFALGLVHPTWSLVALLVASAGSAAFGLIARRSTIAFGPGLALGATAALLLTSLGFGDFIHNDEPTSTVLAQEAT